MRFPRWAAPRVLLASWLALMLQVSTASAQFFVPALRTLDLDSEQISRSARLLGMGGLTLVVPDHNTTYSLWDMSRIPVALSEDDTTSTLDLDPGTDALSSVRSLDDGRERQNLAARRVGSEVEAVYRSRESGGGFAFVGDLSSLRYDQPVATAAELRQSVVRPSGTAILSGVVPRFFHRRLRWGAHLRFLNETVDRQYREIVSNAAGDYIDLGGGELPPPGEFVITAVDVNTTAFGVSTSYALGSSTHIALGIERENDRFKGTNDLQRSSWETDETRPGWNGQAAIVGVIGKSLEWGVNGIGRVSNSEVDWRFTASAGVGATPLSGRGNLLTRDEKSSEMQARARWTRGHSVFSGEFHTAASKVITDAPNANDATSLNRFIHEAYFRPGADTLSLPDSVIHGETRRYAWGWSGGASHRFSRTTVGGEFHWSRDLGTSLQQGDGPQRIAWDIRGGLEHPLGDILKGRLGYQYRSVDEDDLTTGNEYTANAVSFGVGYAPVGASWTLESGYRLEFRSQDFNDPGDERQSRQNLGIEILWKF
jgi:opacity protein-like surface antigen